MSPEVQTADRPAQLQVALPPIVSRGPSTRAVHGDQRRDNAYHSLTPPIVQTATYTFEDTTDLCGFMDARLWGGVKSRTEYGRYGNPTVAEAEARLAALDAAQDALLFSSGMAAVTTVLLAFLSTGAHLIITDDAYRRTRQFCLNFLKRYGVAATVVPAGDYAAMEEAIRPNTRLIISESPTNPYLRVLDLERVADIGRRHGVRTLIDATFATPINQRPIEFGIDLVLHSATKYLGGHGDVMGGVVAASHERAQALRMQQRLYGGNLGPFEAWLILRGVRTLALRVREQCANALHVAQWLSAQPQISQVIYPGLPSHPNHALAQQLFGERGFGGVVAFELRDADEAKVFRFMEALKLIQTGTSLGDVYSLLLYPAQSSHHALGRAERLRQGIGDGLVRLSCGIEDWHDIAADLEQALKVASDE